MTERDASSSAATEGFELPPSGFVVSGGLQIYYRRFGTGSPLILVHGWGADHRSNWLATGWIDALQPHRTLIAIDVRGHGRSDKPYAIAPYRYQALSQDVLAVLDAHQIKRCDFLGYSMGAFMGAYLLGHHPHRFSSMVLGGIGDETDYSAAQGSAIAAALRDTKPSEKQTAASRVRDFVATNPTNDPEALAYSAEAMWPQGYPLELAGPNINAAQFPVLIVNGENDHPYVDSADRLAAALPMARHVRLPDADHLSAVTAEGFKTAVIEFLSAT